MWRRWLRGRPAGRWRRCRWRGAPRSGGGTAGGRHADGLQERRPLVERRVLTAGGCLVVVPHGARQRFRRQAEVDCELLRGCRGERDAEPEEIRLVDDVIGDHVDEAVLVAQRVEPDTTG